ncbi:CubicO group peptidase (beta-lactamase class C family) [Lysobacter niastensis]|uniref:CubicO group peptidase (Beta-lactamase class C family) n=1 Tax=Lysobacter niastensis TaxID=380629 RepID=A0ABU1WEV7_9GAMM|nr:serine hydrolase [Lysobacter niastensis]MDR7136102.1 CubicO group peptidase (beta-lactamase class C family) [Lysobacter niastensis]
MPLHASRTLAMALLAGLMLVGAPAFRVQAVEPAPAKADDPRVDRFRQQLEAERARLKIPGMSAAILEDGDVLWTEGFGYADVEHRVPATPDTLYQIASVTKTFTAILTLRLVEQGKLDLDAPVSRYVPEIKDDRVQIRHLLSHTSEGTPGEKFNYNPDRFEHLKAILEQTTGKPLRQQFVETFLDPLSMDDSVPGPDLADDADKWPMLGEANLERYRKVLARSARPYTYYGDGEVVLTTYPPADFWASAGLVSTVRDLSKYDVAIDRHALLGKAMLTRAWTPVRSSTGEPLPMGLGWYATAYRGERLVWHYGHWGTGFSALYLKIPARKLTLILLANSEALADHHYKVGEDVTNDLFACDFINTFVPEVADRGDKHDASPTVDAKPQAPDKGATAWSTAPSTDCERTSRLALDRWIADRRAKARTIVPLDPKLAAAYAGRYQFPSRIATISREGDRLFLDFPQGQRAELFAQSPTQLFVKIRPWTMNFVREGGRVVRIDIVENGETVPTPRIE